MKQVNQYYFGSYPTDKQIRESAEVEIETRSTEEVYRSEMADIFINSDEFAALEKTLGLGMDQFGAVWAEYHPLAEFIGYTEAETNGSMCQAINSRLPKHERAELVTLANKVSNKVDKALTEFEVAYWEDNLEFIWRED